MSGNEVLSARNLARYGLRRGAYDGANRRRFVLFVDSYNGTVMREEFDTKRERDARTWRWLGLRIGRSGTKPA